MRACVIALFFLAIAAAGNSASAQACREDCDSLENRCIATCDARLDPERCIQKCSAASDRCLAKCNPGAKPGKSSAPPKSDAPAIYCCTSIGKIGPYTNPSVPFGGACIGTTPAGFTAKGKACY